MRCEDFALVACVACSALGCARASVAPAVAPEMAHVAQGEAPSRDAVVAYARRYVELRWEARPAHVFHGTLDEERLRIDTPDDTFVRGGWSVGPNVGVPYVWGGFDTPEDFLRKLEGDHPAGYVERDRTARGSRSAAGVDCSGLVSRSWGLSRKFATRELPSISVMVNQPSDLLPGDILNRPNGHVLLFVAFSDVERTRVRVIEAGAWDGRAWKAVESEYAIERLISDGFVPLRDMRR